MNFFFLVHPLNVLPFEVLALSCDESVHNCYELLERFPLSFCAKRQDFASSLWQWSEDGDEVQRIVLCFSTTLVNIFLSIHLESDMVYLLFPKVHEAIKIEIQFKGSAHALGGKLALLTSLGFGSHSTLVCLFLTIL